MSRGRGPVTAAVRALRSAGIDFTEHLYRYEEKGGTAASARELGLDEHAVVKTLVMEDDGKHPLVVLMHGDMTVSVRELARSIGARSVSPCTPGTAERHTGYLVGGTSPFGTRRPLPVWMEESILSLPRIWLNGGKRGFLVGLDPREAAEMLSARPVSVAVPGKRS